jgi:hypothetical protein
MAALVFTEPVTVWFTVPSDVPLALVSVPLSTPVACRTPLVTLNFWGVNMPLKVPLPAEFVNVPFTAEERLPADAAGAEVAVLPRSTSSPIRPHRPHSR